MAPRTLKSSLSPDISAMCTFFSKQIYVYKQFIKKKKNESHATIEQNRAKHILSLSHTHTHKI